MIPLRGSWYHNRYIEREMTINSPDGSWYIPRYGSGLAGASLTKSLRLCAKQRDPKQFHSKNAAVASAGRTFMSIHQGKRGEVLRCSCRCRDEERPLAGNTLQRMQSPRLKPDTGAGHQVSDRVRDEDLIGCRQGSHPGGRGNRDAANVAAN